MRSVPDATTRALMLQDRRGRHGLCARRRRRRGHQERPGHADRRDQARLDLLDRVHRAVGPEIAVARQAAAAGGQLRARPPADQRGGLPRLLPAGRGHRAAGHGFRAAGRADALRPAEGQAAARRGRLSRTGFDAGEFAAIPGFPTVAEAVVNDLNAAGIRVRLRQMERAAFYADWQAEETARPVHGRGRQFRQRRQPRRSRSSSRRAPTPMAAIPTSTSCSSSRPASATARSARRCSTRSSS